MRNTIIKRTFHPDLLYECVCDQTFLALSLEFPTNLRNTKTKGLAWSAFFTYPLEVYV